MVIVRGTAAAAPVDLDLVRSALADLPHDAQQIMWLKHVDGVSDTVIAHRLGIRRWSVSRTVAHAESQLSAALAAAHTRVLPHGVAGQVGMDQCTATRSSLTDYTRHRVPARARRVLEQHLFSCAGCMRAFTDVRHSAWTLRDAAPALLAGGFGLSVAGSVVLGAAAPVAGGVGGLAATGGFSLAAIGRWLRSGSRQQNHLLAAVGAAAFVVATAVVADGLVGASDFTGEPESTVVTAAAGDSGEYEPEPENVTKPNGGVVVIGGEQLGYHDYDYDYDYDALVDADAPGATPSTLRGGRVSAPAIPSVPNPGSHDCSVTGNEPPGPGDGTGNGPGNGGPGNGGPGNGGPGNGGPGNGGPGNGLTAEITVNLSSGSLAYRAIYAVRITRVDGSSFWLSDATVSSTNVLDGIEVERAHGRPGVPAEAWLIRNLMAGARDVTFTLASELVPGFTVDLIVVGRDEPGDGSTAEITVNLSSGSLAYRAIYAVRIIRADGSSFWLSDDTASPTNVFDGVEVERAHGRPGVPGGVWLIRNLMAGARDVTFVLAFELEPGFTVDLVVVGRDAPCCGIDVDWR